MTAPAPSAILFVWLAQHRRARLALVGGGTFGLGLFVTLLPGIGRYLARRPLSLLFAGLIGAAALAIDVATEEA